MVYIVVYIVIDQKKKKLLYILLFSICEIWLFNSSSGTLHLIICFVRFCLKMGLAGPHGLYVLGSVH